MATTSTTLSKLRTVLTEHIGLDQQTVSGAGDSSLTELGVDSIGVIELEKELFEPHGVDMPEEAPTMTITQIAAYLDGATRSEN
ncbi:MULTISPECIES: phosphopantetheine-binding protein [unclassified Streptomyces]|uniref:Phosphopantetheine-binding protein n=1 Tax=Streptomyces sp. R08 TaxID=3238624 RepID=A0AB39M754_9ACTN|nr:phosphopantetheine-binding protein [Streptomyces sp. NBC_01239]MCX4816353.1 phosphopantetheine-binding protein [Streptomyces sp. NBC_01239]